MDPQGDLDRLVRRLRQLSPRAWQSGDREMSVRRLLGELAGLTAPGRPFPDLPAHALGDAVAVLGGDALADPASHDAAAALLSAALEATR